MAHSPIAVGELARRLVKYEAGGSLNSATAAVAVETACGRLQVDLTGTFGSGGVTALLGRALSLARREHPLLAEVTVDPASTACFTGLDSALAAGSDEEATAAATSILAHLLGLLVVLVGEELCMQPVRKLWPHVASSIREIGE